MADALLPAKLTDLEQSLLHVGFASIVQILPNIEAEVKSSSSWRVYRQDIKVFVTWLLLTGANLHSISRTDLLTYRKDLQARYSNITVNRMFTVARLVVAELVHDRTISGDPLAKKFKPLPTNEETTHTALDEHQCQQLLAAIDTQTIKGKRDYAMVSLMLRCGLRREEVQQVSLGDFKLKSYHHVLDIQGKGDKPATVKIPPDVWGYIEEYMQALQQTHPRKHARLDAPLFISMRKGDRPSMKPDTTGKLVEQRIDIKAIELVVKQLGMAIGVPTLTPHGLRATFITLAMEHGATLEQTQYAARHKDPRTTERYRKRKFNLDNNAVDKLSFLARQESF
jgi:integrase